PRAASDFILDRDLLAAAPRQDAGELLQAAPGVYTSKPGGDAVAHEIFLRGFDAAHGQDIELSVGHIPINQISHIHGQGYADLNPIIPEVVRAVRVTEGVYDPRQGDFAVAGSINFELGVARRGYLARSEGGSFGTFRQALVWAPKGEADETFVAAQVRRTSGFGQNRGSLTGGAIGQYRFGKGRLQGTFLASAHGARGNSAGVIRRDDLEAGRVGFYDSYPDPTAQNQATSSARGQFGLDLEHRQKSGARTGGGAWFTLTDFHLRRNWTGYLHRSMVMPEWIGRGDLVEQQNRDMGFGFHFHHQTKRYRPTTWFGARFSLGAQSRIHLIEQAQNLLQAPQNETWDNQLDAGIRASDLGVFADTELLFTRYLQVRGGVRMDLLHYDIDDRLGNFIPTYQAPDHLVGHRRSALGVAAGPRVSVEARPVSWARIYTAYGQGYRSPQARLLEEGERAPFARLHNGEIGTRLAPPLGRTKLEITAAGYLTTLSQDLAFDPGEGSLEKIGPTRRLGFVTHIKTRPLPWMLAAASITYVHAALTAPPPATPQE
ncbi:MAG: TonB-dependent receptor, partial [Nannocystaceae bacterium]